MSFAWPEYIGYLLLLIPLAVILGYGVIRQLNARAVVVGSLMPKSMMPGLSLWVIILKKVMLFCGVGFLLFSLSGPRLSSGGRPVLRKGADIVFVLDVSRSMNAKDVQPDRLAQAKQEIVSISRAVNGGRQAILLFAGAPFVQCPLTTDHAAFEDLLGMASSDLIEDQGTTFRSALELCEKLLQPGKENIADSGIKGEKIVVLLSDGEDHAGDFVDEAKKMKKEGTHFFAVGVGMNSPVEIPLNESSGVKKDAHGKAVKTTFREESLKMLALETGGFYFHSKADHMVYTELAEKINNISASSRWIMEPVERLPLAQYFLAAGLFFVCAETMTGIGRGKPR
ncbi:MAG: VWA domain-containing protein [Chlorobium sp.]|jgi:Ca-activated chloride channel homolog|nr:MAG: VWA domain-containing protein [Chlorobium sp.]